MAATCDHCGRITENPRTCDTCGATVCPDHDRDHGCDVCQGGTIRV